MMGTRKHTTNHVTRGFYYPLHPRGLGLHSRMTYVIDLRKMWYCLIFVSATNEITRPLIVTVHV